MSESAATGEGGAGSGDANFSLLSGGLPDRLLNWAPASGNASRLLKRSLLAVFFITWLPPFLLSLFDGHAWGGVSVPFLKDIAAQARLLLALPLLIIAEQVLRQRVRPSIYKFIERGLVPAAQRDEFEAALASARSWLDSNWIDLLLLAGAYVIGLVGIWSQNGLMAMGTWYGAIENGKFVASAAGWWFVLVSLPVFQFLLLRWYLRLVVWWRLLARISRIELDLQPLHADRMGGLGFLVDMTLAFAPFLLAQGALVSGRIADKIVFGGSTLAAFKFDLVAVIVVAVLLVLGPLLMFGSRLGAAKRDGLDDYGDLAMRYARDFDGKWLRGAAHGSEAELGSGDIQSLSDFDSSYGNLKDMLVVPFEMNTVLTLVAAVALPMVPLLFTMFSPAELLARVVKLLM